MGMAMEGEIMWRIIDPQLRHITDRRVGLGLPLALLIAAAFLMAQGYWLLGQGVQVTPDSAAFSGMAREHPILSRDFLAGPRPPLVPLVLKGLGGSERLLVSFQWAFHVGAWGALAALFFRGTRSRVLGAALALWTLLVSLLPLVQVWNPFILSESLALSLLPLVFLALPRLLSGTGLRAGMPLIVVLIFGGG